MIAFARAAEAIGAEPGKLAKVAALADYLRTLDGDDLAAAARYFAGEALPAATERALSLGGKAIASAAERVWGFGNPALREAYRATGDIGAALGRLMRPPRELGLFAETLTPASLAQLLDEIARFSGKDAARKRQAVVERILRAAREPLEATYLVKILAGELRIGLREGLVLEAIALAFDAPPESVRRAAMAAGDLGTVALAARAGTLDAIAVRYFAPIGFMLASPIVFGSSYREIADGTWLVEAKYDGIRAQAHVREATVRLYSRGGGEITRSFPEIASGLGASGDGIFDGEIVAERDGRVLPFRYLQTRLQRVDPPSDLLAEIPAVFVAFDALASGDRFLVDEPLVERRGALDAGIRETTNVRLAQWSVLEAGASAEAIAERFEEARALGHEGLVLKRTDAPYVPGRRGKWWLKLKRELSTLDVVVVAVEWGHGKRNAVLSDYTFAVRRDAQSDELLPIGKAYTGLTDSEIATMTQWFLAHRSDGDDDARRGFAVAPETVIEIAFDIVQKSELHASGYSLRFPRIVRLRPDLGPHDADTLADVERIYAEMLEREGVAGERGVSARAQ